jgi:hypothetical protein
MPCTFSHPAAVLPLRRFCPRHFDFPALVVGSMTPDVGYYVHRFDLTGFAHSVAGSIIVCLPIGALLLLLFYLVRRQVCYLLPMPHRRALLALCSSPVSMTARHFPIIVTSLLLGAWSHILWDSFTHETGWFAQRIPWLQEPALTLGSTSIPGYYLLQQLSTVVGGVALLVVYYSWVTRQSSARGWDVSAERWRYSLWVTIISVALLVAIPLAFRAARLLDGYLAVRVFVFRAAVYFVAAVVPMIILVSTIAYYSRRRQAT